MNFMYKTMSHIGLRLGSVPVLFSPPFYPIVCPLSVLTVRQCMSVCVCEQAGPGASISLTALYPTHLQLINPISICLQLYLSPALLTSPHQFIVWPIMVKFLAHSFCNLVFDRESSNLFCYLILTTISSGSSQQSPGPQPQACPACRSLRLHFAWHSQASSLNWPPSPAPLPQVTGASSFLPLDPHLLWKVSSATLVTSHSVSLIVNWEQVPSTTDQLSFRTPPGCHHFY